MITSAMSENIIFGLHFIINLDKLNTTHFQFYFREFEYMQRIVGDLKGYVTSGKMNVYLKWI